MKNLMLLSVMAAMAMPMMTSAETKLVETVASAVGSAEATAHDVKKSGEKAMKGMPMFARVDEIDAAGKSFTQKKKDGTRVKFVVTATTEIHQGDKEAKFEDLKIGDSVAGLRVKKSETEYEVVKISKFGADLPKPEKKAKKKAEAATEAAKKP